MRYFWPILAIIMITASALMLRKIERLEQRLTVYDRVEEPLPVIEPFGRGELISPLSDQVLEDQAETLTSPQPYVRAGSITEVINRFQTEIDLRKEEVGHEISRLAATLSEAAVALSVTAPGLASTTGSLVKDLEQMSGEVVEKLPELRQQLRQFGEVLKKSVEKQAFPLSAPEAGDTLSTMDVSSTFQADEQHNLEPKERGDSE